MSRLTYIGKRSVATVFLLLGIGSLLFLFFKSMPGDYATLIARSGASAEQLEAIRNKWGLNDPLYVQYGRFLMNMLTLDPGTSHQFDTGVWELVRPRLMNSFILVAPATIAAYLLGSLYGALMADDSHPILGKYGMIPPTAIGTTPDFFIGIVLIFLFSSTIVIFPAGGLVSPETYQMVGDAAHYRIYLTGDFLMHYILPFTAITLKYLYMPSLIMRSSMADVKNQDFAYFHRIKGLPKYKQMKHLIKHASFPVITLFPVSMARAISGLVLIEYVFNWPGIGSLLISSVLARDIPVVQFVFILVAVWIVVGNFLVDILYGIIDPRVSVTSDSH